MGGVSGRGKWEGEVGGRSGREKWEGEVGGGVGGGWRKKHQVSFFKNKKN